MTLCYVMLLLICHAIIGVKLSCDSSTMFIVWCMKSLEIPYNDPLCWSDLLHYSDMMWASWQITSNLTVFSTACSGWQQSKHQTPHYRPFMRGTTSDQWIPLIKGQWCGKYFHVMKSSCYRIEVPHEQWTILTLFSWCQKSLLSDRFYNCNCSIKFDDFMRIWKLHNCETWRYILALSLVVSCYCVNIMV